MKSVLLFSILIILNGNLFAQCHDSVQVQVSSFNDNNTGFEFTNRSVTHFTTSGKVSSVEYYYFLNGIWLAKNKSVYVYDQNDSLIQQINLLPVDTGWVNSAQTLFTFSSFGKIISKVYQNWNGFSWYDTDHIFYSYDSSDSLINEWSENNYSGYWKNESQSLYYYDNFHRDTLEISQQGDSISWVNLNRFHNSYNSSGLINYKLTENWVSNAWKLYQQNFLIYNGSVLDSDIIQLMDTTWENSALHTYSFSPFGQMTRDTVFIWNDTIWIPNNLIISDVDQYGHPDSTCNYVYYCNTPTDCNWEAITPVSYSNYDSTGHLLATYDDTYSSGVLYGSGWIVLRESSYGSNMNGDSYASNTDFYYNEIYGNSHLCLGSNTVLSIDSCPGFSYLWNTGETTSSITVDTAGIYSVDVTYPNGFHTYTEPFILSIDSFPPHFSIAPDSIINICRNSSPALSDIYTLSMHYQWFRNDTALGGNNNSNLNIFGPDLKAGIYYLVKYNSCGSDTSAKTTVNLLNIPDATITPIGPLTFCSGGSVILSAPAGNSYHWSTGATTRQITNSGYGWTTVTVTNSSGCLNTGTVFVNVITVPSTPQIVQLGNHLHCSSSATYFQWLLNGDTIAGATSADYIHTSPGIYTIICAYDTLCPVYSAAHFFNLCSVTLHTSSTIICSANCNGTISTISNGTSPFIYNWSTSDTTSVLLNICAGTYWVNVTDSQSCTASDTITIREDSLRIQSINTQDPNCTGCNNGKIIINALNIAQPYHLSWAPHIGLSSAFEIDFLLANQYYVCIIDAHGCSVCDSVTLQDPANFISSGITENKLSIYPNPVNNFLELRFPDGVDAKKFLIHVYNEYGQEVINENFFKNIINTELLNNGLYLIKVNYNDNIYSGIFIKE